MLIRHDCELFKEHGPAPSADVAECVSLSASCILLL